MSIAACEPFGIPDRWGFKADLVRFPDQRFSIATLCNLETINPTTLNNQVAELYLGGQLKPASTANASAPTVTTASRGTSPAVTVADYIGAYRSDELNTTYRVEAVEGELRVHGGLPATRTLQPQDTDSFRGRNYTFRFQRDVAGRVISFTVQAGRVQNITFIRQ